MTSAEACATDEFWDLVEAEMKYNIPTYVKNLMKLCGFDNALSVKTLTDEDFQSLETFARTKMKTFIPPGANYNDYYHMFSAEPESFEILPGHIKMLKEIAKQVDVIIQNSATNVGPVPRTSSGMIRSEKDKEETTNSVSVLETTDFEKQFDDITESNKKLNEILDTMSELVMKCLSSTHQEQAWFTPTRKSKFVEPASLEDGELVVIRYIESPTQFFVQQTGTIAEYDAMINGLCHYCTKAPTIRELQIGMACIAFYKNDSDWYRAEILKIDGTVALTRFVDYGIELNIEINELKEIADEFLMMPKQAISCCIIGFESVEATLAVTEKFEFLAESSNGERRKFRVSTYGIVKGVSLVNLVDEDSIPILDLSMRLLELSFPQEKFREYGQQTPTIISSDCGDISHSRDFPLLHDVGNTVQSRCEEATNVMDDSWSNSMIRKYYQIVNEHLANQFLWQFLFNFHLFRISLLCGGRDFTNYPLENQSSYRLPRPNNAQAARVPKLVTHSVQMQMISNHLGVRQSKLPQNMPSFHPSITPPSMDFKSNHVEKTNPSAVVTVVTRKELPSQYMPTFVSDTLPVHSRHQVYVSHVDDGPYMFSVQLKSSEKNMEQMMASIATCSLQQLRRKPALGMACLARYAGDDQIYRAVVKSIQLDSCQLLYVDYGNSEKVLHNNIYDIPEQYLRLQTFAIRVSLAGSSTLPQLTDHAKNVFKKMVADKTLDMLVVPPDSKTFVQCCELKVNGQSVLDRLKGKVNHVTFSEKTVSYSG